MKSSVARVELWIWVLIYGGLGLLCLGLFLHRGGSTLAWAAVVTGAIIAAIGIVMIALRARMPDR